MSSSDVPPSAPPPVAAPPDPLAPRPVRHVHPRRRVAVLGARVLVWIVYAYVLVTEAILGLGFLLLLFGANPDAGFVAWVYRSLERAMEPFRGMFTPIDLGGPSKRDEVGAVLDTSVLFAMIAYAVVAWLISWLLDWVTGVLDRLDVADQQAEQRAWREATANLPAAAMPGQPAPMPSPPPTPPPTATPRSWPPQ